MPSLTELLSIKPNNAYSNKINREIDLLSFNKKGDKATLFGSLIYRMQKFAADIDLLEKFPFNQSKDVSKKTIINSFIKRLKEIVRNLPKDHYFSEFKCGINKKFDIDIGIMSSGYYRPNPELLSYLKLLVNEGSLDNIDYNIVRDAINMIESHTINTTNDIQNAYDLVFNIIRNYRVLRWTKEDILNGFIYLPNGDKYMLDNALDDNTMVKIDLIILLNGKFLEITNTIGLSYVENGKIININKSINPDPSSLKNEVEKLYYSNKFFSPLKCNKRMYSLSRLIKYFDFIEPLTNILMSDTSLLYQIKSDIDVFILLLDRVKNPPIALIKDQLDALKNRLANVLFIDMDTLKNLLDKIDNIIDTKNKKDILDKLELLLVHIKRILNYQTIKQMYDNGLNPPPPILLPEIQKYDHNLIRQPSDDPLNNYKKFEEMVVAY